MKDSIRRIIYSLMATFTLFILFGCYNMRNNIRQLDELKSIINNTSEGFNNVDMTMKTNIKTGEGVTKSNLNFKIIDTNERKTAYIYSNTSEETLYMYYASGYIYKDINGNPFIEEASFDDMTREYGLPSIGIDIDNLFSYNKLKMKFEIEGSLTIYTIEIKRIQLSNILGDINGIDPGIGDFTMKIWINRSKGYFEKIEYDASYTINGINSNLNMSMKIEAINSDVKITVPSYIIIANEKI